MTKLEEMARLARILKENLTWGIARELKLLYVMVRDKEFWEMVADDIKEAIKEFKDR